MQPATPYLNKDQKLNSRQLAAIYGVSERTLANWRAQGRIPFIRITARCIRYSLADCEKALACK